MTDAQAAAIAKADASTQHGRDLYDQRTYLMHLICKLSPRDLRRLHDLAKKLTEDDWKALGVYAEGLAEWRDQL